MTPATITPAQAFFDLRDRYQLEEDQMANKIAELLGFDWTDGTAGDYSFDSYDSSFELHGVRDDFRATREQCEALFAIGFAHFWVNHRDKTETYYRALPEPHEWRKDAGTRSIVTSRKVTLRRL